MPEVEHCFWEKFVNQNEIDAMLNGIRTTDLSLISFDVPWAIDYTTLYSSFDIINSDGKILVPHIANGLLAEFIVRAVNKVYGT